MKRMMFALAVSALLAAAPAAGAKPRMTTQTLIQGEDSHLVGYGCQPAKYWVNYRGRARDIESYRPIEGAVLSPGYSDTTPMNKRPTVTHVAEGNGRVTWTVAPDAEECARRGENFVWRAGWREWSVEYERKVYAIEATTQSSLSFRSLSGIGIRQLAGMPVGRMRNLQLSNVARYLGRPSRIWDSRYPTQCFARWRSLGLRISFVSFGGTRNCWERHFQSGRISGPALRSWAAVIGDRPGILGGTLPPKWHREKSLALKYFPYGGGWHATTVGARFRGSPARIAAFDLLVGAAGD